MTPDEVHQRIARLRTIYQRISGPRLVIPDGCVFRLDRVEQQLLAALARDQGPSPEHDGYPTGEVGSGGMYAARSSTEAAVLAGYRTEPNVPIEQAHGHWTPPPADPHHQNTVAALQALDAMNDAWRTLLNRLDAIENDRKTFKHSNPGDDCIVCGRWVEGTAADRLRRGMCNTDYQAWLRAGQPPLEWYQPQPGIERARWAA